MSAVVLSWAEWALLLAKGHRGGEDSGVSWVDAAQVGTAAVGLLVAALVAFMPYARRPRLRIEEDEDGFGLTSRERQVLALVAEGATNREIGAQLFMAEKTASVHVSRILAKLDVRSRTEAAAVAHRFGLVV